MTGVSADTLSPEAAQVLRAFERKTGLTNVPIELRDRSDGQFLVIQLANPSERFFGLLEEAQREVALDALHPVRATLKKRSSKDLLKGPEVQLLVRTLTESLTIDRHSWGANFLSRYIRSVSGAEDQIVSAANHVVFGRRGAGKSSLLLYSMHTRERENKPFAWVDMQTYAQRSDLGVVAHVIADILEQALANMVDAVAAEALLGRVRQLTTGPNVPSENELRMMVPDIKRVFGRHTANGSDFVVYLDDFHVIDQSLQPKLLQLLYAFARGNRVYLKLSALEMFTKLWDPGSRTGLEPPHDAQLIKLDYNLTMTDKASEHINSILDSHAQFSGLPSIRTLCNSSDVLNRLVWVAAGVPRDALNLFSQAIGKASVRSQKSVTVTNVNMAASDLVNDKLRFVELDSSGTLTGASALLTRIRDFCLKQQHKNAFLVEIKHDDPTFQSIRELVDLRLLHVINEGIVKRDAGSKHIALILDYGFYIGMRAARGVDLFNKATASVRYDELRALPVFTG